MKKTFLYILILATFLGTFSPLVYIKAQTKPPETDSDYKLLAPLPDGKGTNKKNITV